MSRFLVFVMKTYSGTGKRDFNLGLSFCFSVFFSLPRALTSALIPQLALRDYIETQTSCAALTRFGLSSHPASAG